MARAQAILAQLFGRQPLGRGRLGARRFGTHPLWHETFGCQNPHTPHLYKNFCIALQNAMSTKGFHIFPQDVCLQEKKKNLCCFPCNSCDLCVDPEVGIPGYNRGLQQHHRSCQSALAKQELEDPICSSVRIKSTKGDTDKEEGEADDEDEEAPWPPIPDPPGPCKLL